MTTSKPHPERTIDADYLETLGDQLDEHYEVCDDETVRREVLPFCFAALRAHAGLKEDEKNFLERIEGCYVPEQVDTLNLQWLGLLLCRMEAPFGDSRRHWVKCCLNWVSKWPISDEEWDFGPIELFVEFLTELLPPEQLHALLMQHFPHVLHDEPSQPQTEYES